MLSRDTDEVADLKATLQRVKAEYDNYRKRALRDQQLIAERSKAAIVTQLLPVLDDLDRARSHGDLEAGPLKSVADKLSAALEGLGLSGFGDEGDDFDPALHEAVQHEGEGTHPIVGTVHGIGLYLGVEMVRDPQTLEPATEETAAICDRMLELGVIIQPTGDHLNILKTKPPLCIDVEGADFYVDTLDRVLTEGW